MNRAEFEHTLKKNAYLEIIDFMNRIASTGEPNEIGGDWLAHIPHNTTLQELLNQRGLTGKFMPSTGRYFIERAPIRGKR